GFHLLFSRFNAANTTELINHAFSLYPDVITAETACGSDALGVYATDVMPSRKEICAARNSFITHQSRLKGRSLQRLLMQINRMQLQVAEQNLADMRQSIRCHAGSGYLYFAPNGVVRDCSVAGRELGNLREWNYDLYSLLRSYPARRIRREVRRSGCFCTMTELAFCNLLLSARGYLALTASVL
ncbi:MAG: SPASM domain-containing protein, partial [bacterium]